MSIQHTAPLPALLALMLVPVVLVPQGSARPLSADLMGTGLPATGANTWTVTMSMHLARANHAAILLRDGSVLVVGGTTATSTETYNYRTGTWSPAGALSTSRTGSATTLLPDGTVMVTGGGGEIQQPMSSTEVYDPHHRTWHTGSAMLVGRFGHGAVVLPSGNVLVAGGCCDTTAAMRSVGRLTGIMVHGKVATRLINMELGPPPAYLTSAELYDPRTRHWRHTGSLASPADGASLTVLADGRVLAGGGASGPEATTWETYHPRTGTWTPLASMPYALASTGFTVTRLPSGRVLVVSAGESPYDPCVGAYLYDPRRDSWSPTGQMHTPRSHHTATLLPNGTVLVAGGVGASCGIGGVEEGALKSAEIYDPLSNAWTIVGNLQIARQDHTATLLPNGQVLVAGGLDAHGQAVTSAELFHAPAQHRLHEQHT